ncbi:MAG: hypothetical protein ABFR50_02780 [Candidatus Fermentibacteria bacterium]
MIICLFQISFLVSAGIPVELGPAGRIVFPFSDPPEVIQNPDDFNGIFSSDGPVFLAGAAVRIHLIPSIPVEVSGLFGRYDPYFEYSDEYPDNSEIEFCSGSLTILSLGFQKELGEMVLSAGSDLCLYHETWMEMDSTSYGGYHREAGSTAFAPFAGVGIHADLNTLELDFNIRVHFPDLNDRWLSAGCSLLFF